jgi:methionyl-tRNA formyltransferase
LPHWRGAAPIERAIEAKANEIVVSIIEVVAALDAGDVFMYDRLPITNNLPLSVIYEKCAIMGAEMLLKTMEALKEGKAHKTPQANIDPHANTAYAKKISKQELELDFNLDAITLHRKIWAFSLAGGCYFTRNGERIKILEAEYSLDNNLDGTSSVNGYLNLQTGTIKTADGYIIPRVVQREGKRPLPAAEVWRGLR